MASGSALPAGAQNIKILSVPGHPVSLVLETSEGIITSALLRSPAGIQKILPIEGYMYAGESVVEPYADEDFRKDLLWAITFTRSSSFMDSSSAKIISMSISLGPHRKLERRPISLSIDFSLRRSSRGDKEVSILRQALRKRG